MKFDSQIKNVLSLIFCSLIFVVLFSLLPSSALAQTPLRSSLPQAPTQEIPKCYTCHSGGKTPINPEQCAACQPKFDAWQKMGCMDARKIDTSDCPLEKMQECETFCSIQGTPQAQENLIKNCKLCTDSCIGRPGATPLTEYKCSVDECAFYTEYKENGINCILPMPSSLGLNNLTTFLSIPGGFGAVQYNGKNDVNNFILDVLSIGRVFFVGLAILKIIFGGVMYGTAAGNAQRITEAKSHIMYALLGIALIAGSSLILWLLGADTMPK